MIGDTMEIILNEIYTAVNLILSIIVVITKHGIVAWMYIIFYIHITKYGH